MKIQFNGVPGETTWTRFLQVQTCLKTRETRDPQHLGGWEGQFEDANQRH